MVTTVMDHITFDRSLRVLEVNARTEEKIVACVELESYFNHVAESNTDVTSLPIRSRYEKLMNILLNCLEKDNGKMHLPVLQVLKLAIQVLPKGLGAGMKMASQCYNILLKTSQAIEGNVENSPNMKMLVELFRCLSRFDDPQFIDAITTASTLGYKDHKELVRKCIGDNKEDSEGGIFGVTDVPIPKNTDDTWISSLRLESLRFTSRLIKLCGSSLFKSHFVEEMDFWLDILLPSLFLFQEVYSSNLQKDCDADTRNVTREALQCILALAPADQQMKLEKWPKIKKDIKDNYADRMVKLVGVVPDWAPIWCTVLDVLGGELIKKGNNHLINKLLNVEERAFKYDKIEVRVQAFICWRHLIDKFLPPGTEVTSDAVQRSVRLLIQPLQPNNAKTDIMSRQKLNTWWHLIRHLESDIEKHLKNVLLPFLSYCFGSAKSKEIPPGKKFASIHIPCARVLANILNLEPAKKQIMEKPMDLTNVEECVVLPCSIPLLKSPTLFLSVSEELLHCVGESIVTLSCRSEIEVCSDLLLRIWHSLLHHVSIVMQASDIPSEKSVKLIQDLLRLMQSLIERCSSAAPALANHIINLLKSLLMDQHALSYSVLSSPSYYVGSVQLMTGTPALFLVELMVSRPVLQLAMSNEKYIPILKVLLDVGVHHHEVLEFTQSVLKHLETVASAYYNVNTVERASLCVVWSNVALALTEYLKQNSNVNQGDNKQHDLSCFYLVLLFPFYHLYSISYKETVVVLEVWRELYRTFHHAAVKSIPTLDANEICETVSLKISQALMKHWPSTADQAVPLLEAIQNIVTTIPFSDICRQSSKSKTKFLLLPDRGRSSKPTSYITYTMSLIVKVAQMFPTFNSTGEWYNTVGSLLMNCLETLFKNMKAANVGAAVPMVSGLSDSVLTLVQASPLDDGTARFWTESLQRLWKCYFSFIETYLPQKSVKDFLGWMSGLLEAGFKHSDDEIRNMTVAFWDKIVIPAFAHDKTNAPHALKEARERCVIKETIPADEDAINETFMTTNNNNDISLSSLSGKVFAPSDDTDKMKPHQSLVQQLTDEGHILTKHQKEVFRRRKEDIPALYSSTLQPPQEDSMMSESSQDTSEFVVPSRVVETASTVLNSGEFKEPFPPSFKVLEPPSCLRRTADYRKKMMIDNDGSIVLASIHDTTASADDIPCETLTSVPEEIVADPHSQNSSIPSQTPVSFALVTDSLDPGNPRKLNLESVAVRHMQPDQMNDAENAIRFSLPTPTPLTLVSSVETPISFPLPEPAICNNVVIGNNNVVQSHNLLAPYREVAPLKILTDKSTKNVAVVPKSSGIYGIIPDSRKLPLSDTSNKKVVKNPVKNDYNKFMKEKPKISSGNTFTPVSITVMEESEKDRMRRTVHLSLPPPSYNVTTPAVCPKKFAEMTSEDVGLSDIAPTIIENDNEILEASSMSSVEISTSENDAPLSPVKVVVEKVEDYSLAKTTYAALETMTPVFNIENDKVALQVEVSSSSRRKLKSPLRLKPGDPILPPFKMQNVGVPQSGDQTNSKISSPTINPEKKKENEVLKSIRQVSRTRRGRVGAKREHIKIALGCNLSKTTGENSSPSILTVKTRRNYKPRKPRQSKLSDIAEDLKVIKEASMPSDVISDNSDNKQIITDSGMSFTPINVEINSKIPIAETNELLNILNVSPQKSVKQESESTSKTSEFEAKDVIDASDETQKENSTEHETHKQESIQPVNEVLKEETSNIITKSSKSCKEALLTTGSEVRTDTNEITQMSPKKKVTDVDMEENGTPSKVTKDASVSKKIRLDLTPEKKDNKSLFPKVKLSLSKDRSIHIDKSELSVSSSDPRLSRHRKSFPKLVPEMLPTNEAALPSIPSELITQEISENQDVKPETTDSVSSNIEIIENVMGKRKRTKRKMFEDFICLEDFIPKERRRKLNDSVTQINTSKSKTQSLLEITQVTPTAPDVIMDVEGDVPETLEDIEKEVQAHTALSSNGDNIPKNDASKQSPDISLHVLPHASEVQSAGRESSHKRSFQKKHLSVQDDSGRKRQLPVAQDKHTTNIRTESNILDDCTKNKTPKHGFSNLSLLSESDTVESTSSEKDSNEEETSHKDNVSVLDLHISDGSTIIVSKKMNDHNNGTPTQSCVAVTEVPENNLKKNESNEDSTSHKKQMPLQDKHISDISKNVNHDPKNEITKHSLLPNSEVPNSVENKSVQKHSTEKTSQKMLVSNQIALISDKSIDDSKEKTPKHSSACLPAGIVCNEDRTSWEKQLQVQNKNFSDTSSIVSNNVNNNHKDEAPKCSSTPTLSKLPNSSESRSARKDNNEERTLRKKRLAVQNKQVSEATTVVSKKIDSVSKHEDKKSLSPSLPKVPDSSDNKSTRKDSNKERTSRKKQLPIQVIPISDVSTHASKKASDSRTDKTPKGSDLLLHKMPDSSENKSQGDNKETRSSRRKQVLVHDMHISKVETSKHSSSTPLSKQLDSSENKSVGKDSNEERSSRKKRLYVQDKHVVEASSASTPLSKLPDPSENKCAVKGINERSLRKRLPVKDKHVSDASTLASKKMDHNPQDEIPECSSLPKTPDSSENKSAVNDSNEVRTSRKKRLPIVQDRHASNVLTTDSNKRNDLPKVVETAENKPTGKDSTEEKKSWKKHISGIEHKHIFNENQTTLNITVSRKLRSCYSKPDEILKGDVTNLGESVAKTSSGMLKIESDSKGQKDGNNSKNTSMSEIANDLQLQLSEAVTEMTDVKKHKMSLHDPNKEEGKNSEQIQKSTNRTSITKENAKFEVTKDNKSLGSTENLSQDNDSLDIIESSQESTSTFLFRRPKIHKCSVSMRKIDPILQAGTKIDVSQGNQKYTVLVPEYPYSPFKIYSPEKIDSLKEKEANRAEISLVPRSQSNELEALKDDVHKEVKSKSPKESGKKIVDKSEDLILLQKDSPEVAMNDAYKNVMKDVLKMKTKRGNNQKSEVKAYIPKPKSKQHNYLETVENNTPQSEVTLKPEESPVVFASSLEIAKTRSRKTNSKFEDNVSMNTVDSVSRHRLKKHALESISSDTKDGNKLGKTEAASVKTQPKLRNEVDVIKTSEENPTLQSKEDISNRNAENELDVEKDDKINSRLKQQNSTSKSDSVKSDISKEHSKLLQQNIAMAEDAKSKVELENNTVSVAKTEVHKSKTKQTSLSLEGAASSKDGVVSSIGDVVKLRARHHSKSEELAVTEADQKQKTLQQFDSSTYKEAIKSSAKELSDSSKSKEVVKSSLKDIDKKQSTLQHSDSSKSKEDLKISVKDADQKQSTLQHFDSSKSKEVIKNSKKDGDQKHKILKQSDSSKSKEVIKSSMKDGDKKQKILQQSDSSNSKEVIKSSVKDGDQKQNTLQRSDSSKFKEVIEGSMKDGNQKQKTLQQSDSPKSKDVNKSSVKDDYQKQNTFQFSDSLKSKEVIKTSMKDIAKQKISQQSDSSKSNEVMKSTMKDGDKKQKILQKSDSSKSKEVIKSSTRVGNEKQKQSDCSKSKDIIKSSVKDGDKKQKQSDSSKSKEVISSSAKDGHQNHKTLQQSDSSKSEEVIESSMKDGDQKQKILQHPDSPKPKEVLKSSVKDHQNQKTLQQSDSSKSKEVAKSPVKHKPKSEENMQNKIEVTATAEYSNPQESIDLLHNHAPIISSSMSITEKEFNLNAGVDLSETLILFEDEDESSNIEVSEYNKHAEPNDCSPSLIKSKEKTLCRKNSRADINLEAQPENADIGNKDIGLKILESNVTSTSLEPMICLPHEKPEVLNEDLEDEDQSIKIVVSKIKKFAHYSENCNTRKNQEFHTSMESKHKGTSENEKTLSPSPPRSLMDSPSSLLKAFSSPSGSLDLGRRGHQRRMGGRAQYLVGLAVAAKEKNQEESPDTSPVSSRRPEELSSTLAATPLSRKKLLYNMLEEDVDDIETPTFERLQVSDVDAETPLQHSPASEPRTPDVPLKRALKLSGSHAETPPSKKKKVSFSVPEVSGTREYKIDETQSGSSRLKSRSLISMKRRERKLRIKLLSARSRTPPQDDNSMANDMSSQNQDSPDLTGLSSQGSVDMLMDYLNSQDVFFPPLISCMHPIESIAHHLTTHVMWTKALVVELNRKGIRTVADLSRLDEASINRLPVAAPKIARTKEVLESYHKIIEPSDKGDSKQDAGTSSSSSQMSDSTRMTTSDVVKYITSNKGSLTAILEEVSRLSPWKNLNQEICQFVSKKGGKVSGISDSSSSETNSKEGMDHLEQVLYSDSTNAKHTQGIVIRWLLSSGVNNVIKNLPQVEVARHIVKHYPDKLSEALSENPNFEKKLLQDFFNSQLMSGELPFTEVFDKLAEGDKNNLLLNAMQSYLILKRSPEEILQRMPMESVMQYATARLSLVDKIGLCVQGILSDLNQEIPLSHYQRLVNAVAKKVSSSDFATIHYQVMMDLLNKK